MDIPYGKTFLSVHNFYPMTLTFNFDLLFNKLKFLGINNYARVFLVARPLCPYPIFLSYDLSSTINFDLLLKKKNTTFEKKNTNLGILLLNRNFKEIIRDYKRWGGVLVPLGQPRFSSFESGCEKMLKIEPKQRYIANTLVTIDEVSSLSAIHRSTVSRYLLAPCPRADRHADCPTVWLSVKIDENCWLFTRYNNLLCFEASVIERKLLIWKYRQCASVL